MILVKWVQVILCMFGRHTPKPYEIHWKVEGNPVSRGIACRWCAKELTEEEDERGLR